MILRSVEISEIPALPYDAVNVFICSDGEYLSTSRVCSSLLTGLEQARANKFVHQIDRNRFIVGRTLARQVLGKLLGISAKSVEFEFDNGKPLLAGCNQARPFNFNISHGGHAVILAVSKTHAVGVDVEPHKSMPDMSGVAKRVMTNDEFASFNALDIKEQVAAFFRLWTRKEAVMKCRGTGFSLDPASFTASIDNRHRSHVKVNKDDYSIMLQETLFCETAHTISICLPGAHNFPVIQHVNVSLVSP